MIRLYTLLLLFSSNCLFAQTNNGALSSYEGRHFYVGFMDNEIEYAYDPLLDIYISSKYTTKVKVISHFYNDTTVFTLEKNKVAAINENAIYEIKNSEEVTKNRLIEIISDSPISVVAKNSSIQSGDTYTVIPTRNWGTEHYAVTMPNDYYISPPNSSVEELIIDRTPRLGEFLIMAKEDDTYVEIEVAAETFWGAKEDSILKVVLNKGESYLVKSKSVVQVKGIYDLTGSKITSTKPVGVISGHMRTSIKQVIESLTDLETKDHIAEMIPSTDAWSNEYMTVPFGNGINSYFKVIAKDTIQLTVENDNNQNRLDLLPGEVRNFSNIDLPTHWSANGKFLVVQMMAKYQVNEYTSYYDPAMLVVPPLDKMISKVTYFVANDTKITTQGTWKQYDFQAVLIIAEEKGSESIYVNNTNVKEILGFNEFIAGGTKYLWQKVFLPPLGSIVNIKADSGKFHAIGIGNGYFDSYAMTVGSSLYDEEDVETLSPVVELNQNCSSVEGSIYDEIVSDFSGINLVVVDEVFTENMAWQISEIVDTTTYVDFTAEVLDKNKSAKLKFTASDYFGNDTTFEFFYQGAQVPIIGDIDYKEVNVKNDSCYRFLLTTYADSVWVESIDLPKDLRLKLDIPFTLPKMIYKDEKHFFTLCLRNEPNNFDEVIDSLSINFGCDYSQTINVNATIISYNLTASQLVLPKILSTTNYCNKPDEYLEFKNVGTADIVILGAELPESVYFTIDTVGMFPDTLAKGESLYFTDICFTSDQVGDFEYEITLLDNQGINRKGKIIASAGSPKINNIVYDFGATRIGSLKDTTLEFFNSGDFLSKFTMVSQSSTILNDPNLAVINALDTFKIDPANTQKLDFTYNPIELENFDKYELKAQFVERWEPHDTISITLTGNPTIPKVNTYYIDLDTIEIFDYKDSLAKVITSNGNEKLSIRNIKKLSGDQNVFAFNSTFYDSRILDTATDESLDIRFNGNALGEHKMNLLVESDAAYNYLSKYDTVTIRGYVKVRDTLNFAVTPENSQIISCNYDTLDFQLRNTGNTTFKIDNIDLSTTLPRAELLQTTFNDTLAPGDTYNNRVLVFSTGNSTEQIEYKIDIYDLIQKLDTNISAISNVTSTQQKILINTFNAENLDIGEDFLVKFSGNIPNKVDTTINISFKLRIDIENFYLNDEEIEIKFFDKTKNIVKTVKATATSVFDEILIESDDFIDFSFDNIDSWEFVTNFTALLTSDLVGDIEIFFNLNKCFESNSKLEQLDVNSICIFDFRNVKLSSYIKSGAIQPNIITQEANLIVETSDEIAASIYIIDNLGKKYSLFEKFMFDKGKNNIILNLSNYANGKYILVVNTNNTTLTNEFIISK